MSTRLLLAAVVLFLSSPQLLLAQETTASDVSAQYRISSLDVITVDLLAANNPSVLQVNCNGLIELPLLGKVKATGLTADELAAQLNLGYQKLLKDPQVKVQLKESQREKPIQVTGAVRNPGSFQVREPLSLKAVLGLAGGFTSKAERSVQVRRLDCGDNCDLPASPMLLGCARTTTYQFKQLSQHENIQVAPGDSIHVIESQAVFVVGQVYLPQVLYSRVDLTVMRAIAMAGGVLPNSHVDKARVFRQTADGCFATLEIDLKLIINRKAEDPPLQGGDIIEVSNKYVASRTPLVCPDRSDPLRVIR